MLRVRSSPLAGGPGRLLACWLVAGFAASLGDAAEPPSISRLTPRGGQRGETITVVVEGANLAEAELVSSLSSLAERIEDDEAAKPSATRVAFRVTLNPHEAPGPVALRVRTPGGISPPALFAVGLFPERSEVEPNDSLEAAQRLEPPLTLNGTLGPTDRDFFVVGARAGERLVIEAEARRLGSSVDPTLRLLRRDGRELALSDDPPGLGGDARIDYTFAEDGEYVIEMHDAMFLRRSPDFYRLRVGDYPYADAVFPLGGRAGSSLEVFFEGGSLKDAVSSWLRLAEASAGSWVYAALPPHANPGGTLPFRLRSGELPELIEGARETPDAALPIPRGVTVNGRIDHSGEVDRYRLAVEPGESWRIEVEAAALGSWLDPLLSVWKGAERIALVDDAPGNVLDPVLELKVPEGATELVLAVEDLHRRGGKAYGYRLAVERLAPRFDLKLVTATVSLPLDGTALIEVEVTRRGGFSGAVELGLLEVPPGFRLAGGEVLAEQAKGFLSLSGPPEGALRALELVVAGRGGGAAAPMVRRAAGTIFLAVDQNVPACPLPVDSIAAAVAAPLPLAIEVREAIVEVALGGSAVAEVAVRRRGEAQGEVKITALHLPPEVTVEEAKIAAGAGSGSFRIAASPTARRREGDAVVRGAIQIDKREVTVPAPVFRVRVVEPFRIELASSAVEVALGEKGMVSGRVVRAPGFTGGVELALEGGPEGLGAAPVSLAAGESDFALELAAAGSLKAGKLELKLIASTPLGDPKKPVVHKLAPVALSLEVKEAPPAAAGASVSGAGSEAE
jgi:hypothetical protein